MIRFFSFFFDKIIPPALTFGEAGFLRIFINRGHTQISADDIFSLLDLSKEKLHALRANSFPSFKI